MKTAPKVVARKNRCRRVRAKICGNAKLPRLSIFRSLTKIYAQLIDDENGKTLCAINSEGKNIENSKKAGKKLAEIAKNKKIEECVFDRGGYKFHGRVAAFANGAREKGLQF